MNVDVLLLKVKEQFKVDMDDRLKLILISTISYLLFKNKDNSLEAIRSKSKLSQNYSKAIKTDPNKFNLEILTDHLGQIEEGMTSDEYNNLLNIILGIKDPMIIAKLIIDQANYTSRMYADSASPNSINDLLVKLANVKADEKVLDPSSGIGGTLLTVLNNNSEQLVVGQDINKINIAISQILMEINSIKNVSLYCGDTLMDPQYVKGGKLEQFDVVLSTPPFAVKTDDVTTRDNFNRYPFGSVPHSKADWAFIMNAISSANSDGRSLLIAPHGVLFRGGMEKQIRNNILKDDLFETIISLPANLLTTTSIPTVILVFNHNKPAIKQNKIMFINVPQDDVIQGKKAAELSTDVIDKIVATAASFKEIDGYSKIVENADIDPGSMNVLRYIENSTYIINGKKYTIKLNDFFKENNYQLNEVASISRGYNMTAKNETPDGKYNIMKISDIVNDQLNYDKMSHGNIDERTKVDNYQLSGGDLVLSVRGTTNKMTLIEEVKDNTLINSNLVRIRVNPKLYKPEFLKLFIESPVGQAQLDDIAMGTTIRQIPIKMLNLYQVPRISLEEQTKILHDYDNREKQIQDKMAILKQQMLDSQKELNKQMKLNEFYTED